VAHIACFAIPYSGHVNPTLGVVAELVARGHRVSFAVTRADAERVEEVGAHPVIYQTTMQTADPAIEPFADPGQYDTGDFIRLTEFLFRETVATLPPLSRKFRADRPDAVVYDASCWAGRLLAARWGVAAVRGQVLFASGGGWSLARGYSDLDASHPDLLRVVGGVARLLDRLAIDLTVEEFFGGDDSVATLVFVPRAFQYAGAAFGEDVHFVGPCLTPGTFMGAWRPPPGDEPLVLVSLGTVHNDQPAFFRACLDAFHDAPWRTVVALGDRVDPADLDPRPKRVELHRFVPQPDVLAHCSAFVSHAGMGSLMQSLHFGVPVVAVPQMAEHQANADRLVELGLGRRLARDQVTPAALREAVASVIGDPRTRAAVQAMRDEIHTAGGAPAAADVVETVLSRSL
jgi:MGT family glycosyltransferase